MIELIQNRDGYTIAVLKGDSHQSVWVKEQGTLETDPTVPVRLLPLIKEGDVVIDVGANIGSHTVSYAKKVGEKGMVYAFEPFISSYVALEVNCRDLNQVNHWNIALGSSKKMTVMNIPDDAVYDSGKSVNWGMTRIGVGGVVETTLIQKLDYFRFDRVDFIKMDCEGYEPNVIRGAMETLKRCKPILFIEINKQALAHFGFTKDDILKPLAELGYKIDGTPDLEAEQVDILFMLSK